jgi:hypothetical protein
MTAFLADLKDFGMSEAIEPVQRIRRTDWYRNRKVYGPEQAPQDSGDMGRRFIYASWGVWMGGGAVEQSLQIHRQVLDQQRATNG